MPVLQPGSPARFVRPVERHGRTVQRPAHHLVGSTTISGRVVTATLRITAHGLYEAFLNGERVGDRELTPGFTSYRTRLQVQEFDVTGQLRDGENVLGVLLSDGWWRGQNSGARWTDSYGTDVAVLAELVVDDGAGPRVALATGPGWRSTPSHVLAADLFAGEVHDLRLRVDGWASPGTDRSGWDDVTVADDGLEALRPTVGPPVRRTEELPAVSVREVAPGRHIVDFGQNSNGWVRLTDLGPAGTRLTLVHAEELAPGGDDIQADANAAVSASDDMPAHEVPPPFQTDVVVSAGDGSVFEPRHSTKGFRYVRVEGHPGPLDPASMASVVVHSDVPRVGGFSCSDPRVDALHEAVVWGLRTNLCEIPTDCPARERAGWTGDWQVFVQSAAYLCDVTDFSRKWLLDLAAEQRADGAVMNFVPDPTDFAHPREDALWPKMQGSAGWGDAAVHVPWELHLATGRTDVLEQQLDSMRRWVDFAAERARSLRHPDRVAARPDPAPHETYVWDGGFHFGEWNEPGGLPGGLPELLRRDQGPTATAFLFRSASELAQVLETLGDTEGAGRYRDLADRVREAWQLEFLDSGGHVQPRTQANLVRALAFDLLPAEHRATAADDLVALVRAAGTHVGTGFLATPFLLPVLADSGHLDVAYDLLLQESRPSWLAMLLHGATTVWENWSAIDDEGIQRASVNHYSMGAVVSFLHRYVAGLQVVQPGYRRFRVAPHPGGGITHARTHHDSPYGRIEVAWQAASAAAGSLSVTVPAGTAAQVVLPSGARHDDVGPGHHRWEW